jgi:hypothetical protein
MTKRMFTDDMLRAAVRAMVSDRIQGFSTPHDSPNGLNRHWGAPHYIRDVWKPPGEQELWRGNSHDEMIERCAMERLRLGINAALDVEHGELTGSKEDRT